MLNVAETRLIKMVGTERVQGSVERLMDAVKSQLKQPFLQWVTVFAHNLYSGVLYKVDRVRG